ncbi:MAG: alpha-L-rhamnosidase [Oscillospiraceae bacterium]|nr:alpha-L-rhamnosidase [Oscillospiraceae bacterium]
MKNSKACNAIKTTFILPTKTVCERNCENSPLILNEMPRQTLLFCDRPYLTVKKGGYIVLDFGRELQGGVTVTLPAVSANSHLRIVFGESVSEAMSSIGYKNATNDHSIRDIVLPVTSWQNFRYGNTGFRFVKLEAVDNDISISCVQAVSECRDLEYKGEFLCNDPLLNKIWQVGAYTVQLNMQEYLWDGIKRDRLVWVGDMHPEISTILSVFGDNEVIKNSLDFISRYTPAEQWMDNIPSYNMWWLKIQYDYYMWSGDADYLISQKKYICDMVRHILSTVNPDGTHIVDYTFTEWSSYETEFEKTGFQAMLAIGIDSAKKLSAILDEKELATECEKALCAVKRHVYPYTGNKQVAAMLSFAGMVDAKEISENIIKPGKEKGFSSFWGYYALKVLAQSGNTKDALQIIRNYWGKMLELGATTFWEDFDVTWAENAGRIDEPVPDGKRDIHGDFGRHCYKGLRHSLCHGWASGPTAFLSNHVLGINVTEAGCKKIKIKPDLGNLTWAKGKYPTPYGEITVEHQVKDGQIKTFCSAPPEIEVSVENQT